DSIFALDVVGVPGVLVLPFFLVLLVVALVLFAVVVGADRAGAGVDAIFTFDLRRRLRDLRRESVAKACGAADIAHGAEIERCRTRAYVERQFQRSRTPWKDQDRQPRRRRELQPIVHAPPDPELERTVLGDRSFRDDFAGAYDS